MYTEVSRSGNERKVVRTVLIVLVVGDLDAGQPPAHELGHSCARAPYERALLDSATLDFADQCESGPRCLEVDRHQLVGRRRVQKLRQRRWRLVAAHTQA